MLAGEVTSEESAGGLIHLLRELTHLLRELTHLVSELTRLTTESRYFVSEVLHSVTEQRHPMGDVMHSVAERMHSVLQTHVAVLGQETRWLPHLEPQSLLGRRLGLICLRRSANSSQFHSISVVQAVSQVSLVETARETWSCDGKANLQCLVQTAFSICQNAAVGLPQSAFHAQLSPVGTPPLYP